jgi:hypothetical protein
MNTSEFIQKQKEVRARSQNFLERAGENPCTDCSAPCCRMLLIPQSTPSTFMELDYICYMLGFPNVRMLLNSDGQWQVLIEQTCQLFDEKTNLCTVHNSPRKPKTCAFFNPYSCWYRLSFHNKENPPELIQIDMKAFENILPLIRFGEDGNIMEIPTWEVIRDIVINGKAKKKNQPS